jgi:hypothetical protein
MSANATVQAHSPSAAPVRKVTAAGLAGAITAIIVWILATAFKVDIPPEIASAITIIVAFAAAYLIPPGPNDVVASTAGADSLSSSPPR